MQHFTAAITLERSLIHFFCLKEEKDSSHLGFCAKAMRYVFKTSVNQHNLTNSVYLT